MDSTATRHSIRYRMAARLMDGAAAAVAIIVMSNTPLVGAGRSRTAAPDLPAPASGAAGSYLKSGFFHPFGAIMSGEGLRRET